MHAAGGLILAVFSAGPALAADIAPCAGGIEISRARVVRVEQNGAMILSDGRALLLEGIRLPLGAADKAPRQFADQARATLLTLARDGLVTGAAVAPKQDRYDRVRVQGFTETMWLQRALLEQGLARVSISPDRRECADALYGFEALARNARRGIWANNAYRIRGNRDDWRSDIGNFTLIEGRVSRVTVRDDRIVLDFSTDGRTGLLGVVTGDDRRIFRQAGDPAALEGRRVRVRGVVQDVQGRPQIALGSAAQLELLDVK
jgi:endonuclease YncB( thermonuclease family)